MNGRERELRERDGSHKRAWNNSQKLRERTPRTLTDGAQKSFFLSFLAFEDPT